MPSHATLGAAVAEAAATSPKNDLRSQLGSVLAAVEAWVLSKGKSFIDTPEERSALEAEAVKAFNAIFAEGIGPAATAVIDGLLLSAIDFILRRLNDAVVIPAPTPDPPAPQPQGHPQGATP